MVQTLFRCLLYCLGIGKICPGRFFLTRGIQETVVSLRNLKYHVAVCVVECEVRCQGLGFRSVDSAGTRSEVKDRVVQIEHDLKFSGCLTEKTVHQINLVAVDPKE